MNNKVVEYRLRRYKRLTRRLEGTRYDAGDDTEWITVKGTHIPVGEDGELKGKVGREIESHESGKGASSTKKETARTCSRIPRPIFDPATPHDYEVADKALADYRQKGSFSNPSVYKQAYKGLSAKEYCEKKKSSMDRASPAITGKFSDSDLEAVKSTYNRLCDDEVEITRTIQDAMKGMEDVRLDGIEARVKEGDSYLRKVSNYMSDYGLSAQDAADIVEDAVRYTQISSADSLVDNYNKTVKALEAKGCELVTVENHWMQGYYGMNSLAAYMRTENGTLFEMWFHTPDSFETLHQAHGYYEAFRVRDDKEDEISTSLNKVLFDKYYSLDVPKDIETISSFEHRSKPKKRKQGA